MRKPSYRCFLHRCASTPRSTGSLTFSEAPRRYLPLWLVTAVMLLAVCGWLGWDTYLDYQVMIEREYTLLAIGARNRAAHITSLVRSSELMLDNIEADLTNNPAMTTAILNAMLKRRMRQLPETRNLVVTDRQGRVIGTNIESTLGFDVSQREYFTHLRDADTGHGMHPLFITRPFKSASGVPNVSIVRSLHDPSGRFNGVVLASIDLAKFREILNSVESTLNEESFVIHDGGDIVYAVPNTELLARKSLGGGIAYTQHIASGKATTRHRNISKITGREMVSVFHKVPGTPLIVAAVRPYADVVAPWKHSVYSHAASFALIAAFLIFLTWLSGRRQVELAQQEEKFRTVAAYAYDWESWESPKGEYLYISPSCERVSSYRREEFLANSGLMEHIVLPEDVESWRTHHRLALEDSGTHEALFRIRCRDGSVRWIEHLCNPVYDSQGSYLGRRGSNRDITNRKLAEEALRKSEDLLQLSESQMAISQQIGGTGSWVYIIENNVVQASANSLALFGFPPVAKDYALDDFLACIPDRDRVGRILAAALSEGRGYEDEFMMNPADGSSAKVIHAIGRIEKDVQGKPFRILGFIQDITEHKKDEAEILRSNAELEQFSYSVSHDMRQPLRMISSYLKLLEQALADQLDSEKHEYFNFAIDGAKRMDAMMLGLLDYSRVGRKGEPPAWVESRALLDEALLFLEPAIDEAKADVRVHGDWPKVLVSPDEMMRLMQNLIGNAVKFRVPGRTPAITVTSEVIDRAWRVCVADNGAGILPGQIGRLFQVFQRLQSRAAYEGNGIGLALCRKIAEHHGGKIWAESEGEDKGSRFCFTVPLKA